jgi:hypothetical protein
MILKLGHDEARGMKAQLQTALSGRAAQGPTGVGGSCGGGARRRFDIIKIKVSRSRSDEKNSI